MGEVCSADCTAHVITFDGVVIALVEVIGHCCAEIKIRDVIFLCKQLANGINMAVAGLERLHLIFDRECRAHKDRRCALVQCAFDIECHVVFKGAVCRIIRISADRCEALRFRGIAVIDAEIHEQEIALFDLAEDRIQSAVIIEALGAAARDRMI